MTEFRMQVIRGGECEGDMLVAPKPKQGPPWVCTHCKSKMDGWERVCNYCGTDKPADDLVA